MQHASYSSSTQTHSCPPVLRRKEARLLSGFPLHNDRACQEYYGRAAWHGAAQTSRLHFYPTLQVHGISSVAQGGGHRVSCLGFEKIRDLSPPPLPRSSRSTRLKACSICAERKGWGKCRISVPFFGFSVMTPHRSSRSPFCRYNFERYCSFRGPTIPPTTHADLSLGRCASLCGFVDRRRGINGHRRIGCSASSWRRAERRSERASATGSPPPRQDQDRERGRKIEGRMVDWDGRGILLHARSVQGAVPQLSCGLCNRNCPQCSLHVQHQHAQEHNEP